MATKEHLEKRSEVRNEDSRFEGTADKRWTWRLKTELDGEKWSVAYAQSRIISS